MLALGLFENSKMSLSPLPPAPIAAMVSLSLGATKPRPSTCLGTIKNHAAASELDLRKSLLELFVFIFIYDWLMVDGLRFMVDGLLKMGISYIGARHHFLYTI